jgi:HCOMODA/2-hydroxy-3-carboxy-muconic semialdehyde decarboxylase
MTRATRIFSSVLMVLGTGFLGGCASEPRTTETRQPAATEQTASHSEQALLEDLVLANRMLARKLDILDIQGHVTARSRINPNHYFIARFLSPGGVTTSDLIENDLDSNAVKGPRTDQAREIYLHGEIYKARPDVMAIVHAHTPELVAFGMTSVPLWNGESMVPVWDIRPFNRGRPGVVSTPALGRAMAEKLARNQAVLLWGHGVAVTGSSLADVVSRVNDLRNSARLQQAVISMGGAWKPRVEAGGKDGASASDRTWEYFKRAELKDTGGRVPTSPKPAAPKPADPDEATARDLVLANRILASEELGILDTFGHVSMRNSRNPNSYFVAPGVSAGAVTARDVVQRDITKPGNDTQGLSIHDEVYKARPDVMAVLYARTPEVVAFTEGAVKLRPVVNGGAFIGDGLPVFNIGSLDPRQPILGNPALGRGVADALGKKRAVLLAGHGFVLTAASVYNLVDQAYQLRMNAKIQQQAIALRGTVAHLDDQPAAPAQRTEPAQPAPTGPAEGRAWVYWSQSVSID